MRPRTLLLLPLLLAAIFTLAPNSLPSRAHAQEPAMLVINLSLGWDLVGWAGPTTPRDVAIGGLGDSVDGVATFDAVTQSFATWNASVPAALNTLTELRQGQALWIRMTAPRSWEQPVIEDPGSLDLRAGFNLLAWTGPSGLDPATAFQDISASLGAGFRFNPQTSRFTSFGPSRPAFINDLEPLRYGDGFWAFMESAATWTQPAAPAPVVRALLGSDVTLTIPRGALPSGVDPESIQVADITQSHAFLAVAHQAPNIVLGLDLQPSGLQFGAPVTITTTLPVSGETQLFGLLSTGDEFELVPDLSLSTTDGETMTVSAEIEHFSLFWLITHPNLVTAEGQSVGEILVGTRFDASVTISVDASFDGPATAFGREEGPNPSDELTLRDVRVVVDPASRWGPVLPDVPFRVLTGAVTRVSGPRIVPFFASTTIPIDVRQTFSCDGAGDFVILFMTQVSLPVLEDVTPGPGSSIQVPDVDAFVTGTCIGLSSSISFFSSAGGGQYSQTIPQGEDFELLVHADSPLPPLFPLMITIRLSNDRADDVVRSFELDGDPAVVCADPNDPNWCSLPIEDLFLWDRVEITVRDKDGNVIAFSATGSYDPAGG